MLQIICNPKFLDYQPDSSKCVQWFDLDKMEMVGEIDNDSIELKTLKDIEAYLKFKALPGKSLRFIIKHPSLFPAVSKFVKENYETVLREETVYLVLTPHKMLSVKPILFRDLY